MMLMLKCYAMDRRRLLDKAIPRVHLFSLISVSLFLFVERDYMDTRRCH